MIPVSIKSKLDLKKRLLKKDKQNCSNANHSIIKILNKEIAAHFHDEKRGPVKQAMRGGGVNLRKAVRLAKDLNVDSFPSNLTLNDVPIVRGNSADCFARYFSEKIGENLSVSTNALRSCLMSRECV